MPSSEQQLRNEREHNKSASAALTQSLARALELYNEERESHAATKSALLEARSELAVLRGQL
jgi:hypothetical protein